MGSGRYDSDKLATKTSWKNVYILANVLMGKNAINEINFQYSLFVISCTPEVKRVLRYDNLMRGFFFEENAGLPDREARPWLLSEHGFTHAVMQVSDCKNKGKRSDRFDENPQTCSFFHVSVHACTSAFSVLDLNAFERQNKAEGLGMAMDESSGTAFIWKSKRKIHFCKAKS